ncbi:DNA helicase [Gluconacetobacter azotocaptans]|uniref:DNA helicase n=1 Tax=Gluconacetobacter azotocaptans TaxID=142834 RepID=A0A7W4JRY4_9PROT|nr:helicase-related protein [Gluconacetobacter azotocaptans]MBB2189803.1 DNA helicase [Gluconacetobacter azotocaptans]MBM9402191.1 DNA helicase [Gluconacetobacter azotocaptans]
MTGVPMGAGPLRAARRASDTAVASRVRAVLGPTNTGKTHLAIERLLAHSSGVIGFPLRLLARENYERMVAAKGAGAVALITGEEKIIPPGARWFSCTVEAMPLDRMAEFVAVDEIQLCADPDRGHVFTDRLLHARGLVETMFLGAETIRPLLRRLVPGVEIENRPRLSQLAHVGASKLTRLPPRSAIVAFSATEVYAIAELIRRRRGGCAVVMGQLSPRTRNAQVALYQDREVDYLVATDAIGMGLNMDVNHVAFAGLSKFDGSRARPLTSAEIAQIAGRAGRGMRDGTFGTTGTCPALPDEVTEAVETHRFDPIERLFWRSSDLDFASPEALLTSLSRPPPTYGLTAGNEASDVLTLSSLSAIPDIRTLARSSGATRLLWEACQIPDFRKLGDETHTRLCARIFTHVIRDGHVPAAWMESQIAAFARPEGDIDSLMHRLSGIRVCSYIAARRDWVRNAEHWQARARDVEDQLSDALHERLTARFVDRRAASLIRRLDESSGGDDLLSAVTTQGEVVVEGHPVGRVAGLDLAPDPECDHPDRRLLLRAARRALRAEIPRRVHSLTTAGDDAFEISPDGRCLLWDAAPIARLRGGDDLLRPRIDVLDNAFLDGAQRERIRARLTAWLDRQVHEVMAPLFAARAAVEHDPALRGILHRLMEQGGVAIGGDPVAPILRGRLKVLGVRVGRHAILMPGLLRPAAMRLRAVLLAARAGRPLPVLPPVGAVSVPVDEHRDPLLTRMGWIVAGPVRLRLDIAEKLSAELRWRARNGPVPLPDGLPSRLGARPEAVAAILKALDIPVRAARPLKDCEYGPAAPPMLAATPEARRRHRHQNRAGAPRARTSDSADEVIPVTIAARPRPGGGRRTPAVPDGPFAVLATLKKRQSS